MAELSDIQNMASEFEDLAIQHGDRLDRYAQYRQENEQVRDPDMEYSIRDLSDYGRRPKTTEDQPRHRIPLPLGLAQTVKHTFRVSGQLPDLVVDERDSSEKERYRSDSMEKIAWAIIRASGSETLFSSGGWDGSQLGATAFDLWLDPVKNMPVINVCDPAGIIPIPGAKNPHDFNRVYRVWNVPVRSVAMDYKEKVFRGQPVRTGDLSAWEHAGSIPMVKVVQMTDKQTTVMFAHGKDSVVGLEEYQHNYGFVPYVIIPNIGKYEDVFGWADYEFIRALQHYISALFSRQADVIRSVANGAMIERGTGQTPEAIKAAIHKGGIIPSRKEGSIEPVQAPDMPAFASEHQDVAMKLFKMLGFAPDAAWGEPGSSSGQDRGLQLQPLIEYTAMKQMNWSRGLSRLFEYAYRMIEDKMVGTATYRGNKPSGPAGQRSNFSFYFGPDAAAIKQAQDATDPLTGDPVVIEFPRNPKELFDADYCIRFVWRNRLDPDDPSYVTSELAKFTSGAQSLRTTLERLGVEAPEEEIRRIESEADRYPWLNNGMVALLKAQLSSGQGAGGGNPGTDPAQQQVDALGTMNDPNSGIGNDANAQLGTLPNAPPGPQYG